MCKQDTIKLNMPIFKVNIFFNNWDVCSISVYLVCAQQVIWFVLWIWLDNWKSGFSLVITISRFIKSNSDLWVDFEPILSENTRTEPELSHSKQFFRLFIQDLRNGNEKGRLLWERQSQICMTCVQGICVKYIRDTENFHHCLKVLVKNTDFRINATTSIKKVQILEFGFC